MLVTPSRMTPVPIPWIISTWGMLLRRAWSIRHQAHKPLHGVCHADPVWLWFSSIGPWPIVALGFALFQPWVNWFCSSRVILMRPGTGPPTAVLELLTKGSPAMQLVTGISSPPWAPRFSWLGRAPYSLINQLFLVPTLADAQLR